MTRITAKDLEAAGWKYNNQGSRSAWVHDCLWSYAEQVGPAMIPHTFHEAARILKEQREKENG